MLTTLSAMTPRPTQRSIPVEPLYRQRSRPCRRLTTLMRPSHPVRHFWPLRSAWAQQRICLVADALMRDGSLSGEQIFELL